MTGMGDDGKGCCARAQGGRAPTDVAGVLTLAGVHFVPARAAHWMLDLMERAPWPTAVG